MTLFVLLAVGLIFATTSVISVHQITIANSTTNNCVMSDFTISQCSYYSNNVCHLTCGQTVIFKFYYNAEFNAFRPRINIDSINSQGASIHSLINGYVGEYTPEMFIGNRKTLFTLMFNVLDNYPKGIHRILLKISDSSNVENVCKFDFNLGIV